MYTAESTIGLLSWCQVSGKLGQGFYYSHNLLQNDDSSCGLGSVGQQRQCRVWLLINQFGGVNQLVLDTLKRGFHTGRHGERKIRWFK